MSGLTVQSRKKVGSKSTPVAHTPGPWHWHKCLTRQHLHDEGGSCFAQVSMPSPHNMPIAEAPLYRANASLIAAAPELLEMLKAYVSEFGSTDEMSERARAIIAKAEYSGRG